MKKYLSIFLTVLIMVITMAGCAASSQTSDESAASDDAPVVNDEPKPDAQPEPDVQEEVQPEAQPVTLKIFNSKTEIVDALTAMKADYETEFPHVTLEIETVASMDYDIPLQSKFAGGEAPDIFHNLGDSALDTWIDYLEDLSDQPWAGDVLEVVKSSISKDGKLYGMPLSIEGYGIVYNKDLFEQAGITALPTTFTELQVVVDQLKSAGITPFATCYQGFVVPGRFGLNNPFAKQPGGGDQFLTQLNDGTASFIGNSLYDDYFNLLDLEISNANDVDPLSNDYNTQMGQFTQGDGAMVLRGNWIQPLLDDLQPGMNVGIFPLPLNDDKELNDTIFIGQSTNWVINKESPVKEEAKNFLNWLVTSETGKRYLTEEMKLVPALKTLQTTEAAGPLSLDVQKYINDGKVLGYYWPKYPTGVIQEFGGLVGKYIAGEASREQVLTDMQNAWNNMK